MPLCLLSIYSSPVKVYCLLRLQRQPYMKKKVALTKLKIGKREILRLSNESSHQVKGGKPVESRTGGECPVSKWCPNEPW